MIDFYGKRVILTGGSRGIGKETKELLEDLGASVLSFCSSDYDLTTEEGILGICGRIEKEEKIDVCINNAGIIYSELVENFSSKEYDRLMCINLRAPLEICSTIIPKMIEAEYGRIVNISSIAASRVRDGRCAYSISKHALTGMTKNLSVEYSKYNILSNTVSPGFTMTEMTKSMLPREEMESLVRQVPIARFATTRDIANVIAFMASDSNSYISGQDIIVDGGFLNAVVV
jgi:3-oxoacyl-[acyl-carrier protein] reductase